MIQVREQYGNIYLRILDTKETFDYTLEKVCSLTGRTFKPNTGEWFIGRERIGEVMRLFHTDIVWMQPLEEIVRGMEVEDELVKKHLEWNKNDDFKDWKIKPFPYQRTGCHFLADRGQAATFDAVGLGKSAMLFGAFQILKNRGKARRCLIVTISAVKRQFAKEIEKFTPMKAIAVSGTASRREKMIREFARRDDLEFMVINYEMLRQNNLLKLIKACNFDVVALDEAHKIKTGVTDTMLKLKPSGLAEGAYAIKDIPYRFLATATPLQGKPQEIWSLFHFMNEDILGPWEYFRERYTTYHPRFGVNGAQNEGEFYTKISPHFIRRTKEMPEIQQQLPAVKHDQVFLEMTDTQCQLESYILDQMENLKESIRNKPMTEEEKEKADGIMQGYYTFLVENCDTPELFAVTESGIAKKMLAEVKPKHLNKSPKLEYLEDFIKQSLYDEPSSKFIIFSRFERMVNIIAEHLSKFTQVVTYHGQLSESMREFSKESFVGNPNVKVIVGSDAMSTGVNLQVANHIIHFDMPWDPTMIEQRNGRADRTGNTHPNVFISYLIMSESYEELLLALIQKKNDMATNILDGGQVRGKNGDIYKQAMDKLMKSKQKKK